VPQYTPKPPSSWRWGAISHDVTPLASFVIAIVFIVSRSSSATEPSPPPITISPVGDIALDTTPRGNRVFAGPAFLNSLDVSDIWRMSPEVVPTYM
jgi:hypothetical protein